MNNTGVHNHSAGRKILLGNELANPLLRCHYPDGITFEGTQNSAFNISTANLSKGTLFIGSTGCGKSNAIKTAVKCIIKSLSLDDCVVIFDSKQDYMEAFYESTNPNHIVISTLPQHHTISKYWNVFRELYDTSTSLDSPATEIIAREISESLLKGIKSSSQPFFSISANDLLTKVILSLIKEAQKTRKYETLTNHYLASFINKADTQAYYDLILKYPEYSGIKAYLGSPTRQSDQAIGVLGTLSAAINNVMIGSFRDMRKAGAFSIRELIRNKGARVIFIEYDVRFGNLLKPIYSLLIDLAISEALSVGKGNTYFICDELNLVPYCSQFQNACNFGRSRGVKLIAGIQAITQLYNNYGEFEGKNIAAGFCNAVCFRSVDAETRQYISERFGTTFESVAWAGQNEFRNGFTVMDADIRNLDDGECFCDIVGCRPFRFKFELYH